MTIFSNDRSLVKTCCVLYVKMIAPCEFLKPIFHEDQTLYVKFLLRSFHIIFLWRILYETRSMLCPIKRHRNQTNQTFVCLTLRNMLNVTNLLLRSEAIYNIVVSSHAILDEERFWEYMYYNTYDTYNTWIFNINSS